MPAIAVPKTRVLSGPGYLYRTVIGSPLPGELTASITTKALASNVATLTTSPAHGLIVGQSVTVDLTTPDAVFDGVQVVTAVTTTTFSFAKTNADVTSVAAPGTATSSAGGVVVGSVFIDAWPAIWIPIGVTKDGSETSTKPDTGNLEVAEYLYPVRVVMTGTETKVTIEIAEYTARNKAWTMNGGTLTTVSGAGSTLLTKLAPPTTGQEVRTMIGWESEDGTERAVYRQLLQTGDVKTAHKKGTDYATLPVEFTVEQPVSGDPFEEFFAGTTALGS